MLEALEAPAASGVARVAALRRVALSAVAVSEAAARSAAGEVADALFCKGSGSCRTFQTIRS